MDSEVFTKEFSPLLPKLTTIAGNWTKNRDDAEDLAQETLIKCWENLDKYKPGSDALGWAARVMRNLITDATRAKKTPENFLSSDDTDCDRVEPSFETELVELLSGSKLSTAISGLSVDFQDTLQLTLDGFSAQEVADLLDIQVQTVYSRLKRIRRHIGSAVTVEEARAELCV